MPSTPKTCVSRTNSSGLKTPWWTSTKTRSSPNCHHRSQVSLSPDPRLPAKHFGSQKFHDNAYPMHYAQEPHDVPAPQHTPHSSMARHAEPWQKPSLYKTESPGPLVNPGGPKSEPTMAEGAPGDFRPSRSRPSFSDNASLELLYSLFSRRNF